MSSGAGPSQPGTGDLAVVLVDHGSREEAANAVLEALAAALRARLEGAAIHVAHLEVVPPRIAEALDRCAEEGRHSVVICPCFLAPGRHAKRDLPRIAEEARKRHPGMEITVAAPLGAHSGLVEALADRIGEARAAAETR